MSIIIRQASAQDAASIQRVWTAAFSNDTHTLFKAHEKGKDLSKELPLDLIPSWIDIDPKKGTFLVAEDTKGKLLGWSAWNYYNLDGSKQDASRASMSADGRMELLKLPSTRLSSTTTSLASPRWTNYVPSLRATYSPCTTVFASHSTGSSTRRL